MVTFGSRSKCTHSDNIIKAHAYTESVNIGMAECIFNVEFTRGFAAKSEQLLKAIWEEESITHCFQADYQAITGLR